MQHLAINPEDLQLPQQIKSVLSFLVDSISVVFPVYFVVSLNTHVCMFLYVWLFPGLPKADSQFICLV